ncbi:hypothetical protein MnTg02_01088 [bacterium MnTg02]|nr:hypothetical protein MnTg02_01088 [bacterium MnTg02]
MIKFKQIAIMACTSAVLLYGSSLASSAYAAIDNDYPTVTIADYVFGCMASNGQTRQALEKCSCSIDIVASLLTYDQYVEAETIMRLRHVAGEKGTLFRTGAQVKKAFAKLKRAQAEAEIRCF